ncbi:MAG: glycoside hydrolase family 5 protein [Spirochaetales bacterium]|nr:glycoside hydrolase family 5 protein [Spirochaetales bacterium]
MGSYILHYTAFLFPVVLLSGIICCATGSYWDNWPEYPGSPGGPDNFIRIDETDAARLATPQGTPFLIRGISFGNHVWGNPPSPAGFTHHRADDYGRIAGMGFNAVRFYMNYGIFEDDTRHYQYKDGGFAWLDANIAAARTYGIRLVLNMHYPQGGFQSNGNGDALWSDRINQLRLIALWKEIARRYRNEDYIIGYGLVNEPVPLEGVPQWKALAQEIIDAIREVDPYHLIFVERANWLKSESTQTDEDNLYFPAGLDDPGPENNIVYEYHMYEPFAFTHQNAGWVESTAGKFSVFPDPNRVVAGAGEWAGFAGGNPQAPTGTSSWTVLEGNLYRVTDPAYRLGRAVVQAHSIGKNGTVYADDFVVEAYDEDGRFVREAADIPVGTGSEWYFWSADGSGSGGIATGVSGSSGGACLRISGTTDDAVSSNARVFIVRQGYRYKISGRIRGDDVASGATVRFRVDFYSCDGDIYTWNRDYLRALVSRYAAFSRKNGLPLYLGEFGTITDSFRENRGGLSWVGAMLDILGKENVNYNYHTFHETAFGLYANPADEYPRQSALNVPLADLFMSKQTL